METKENWSLDLIQLLLFIVIVAGAAASLAFTLHAGRHNASAVLPVVFTIWVLSPDAALALAVWKRDSFGKTSSYWLYTLVILIVAGTVLLYSGKFIPPGTKNAFSFLVGPLISWICIFCWFLISRRSRPLRSPI